jgi:hypothetical protein
LHKNTTHKKHHRSPHTMQLQMMNQRLARPSVARARPVAVPARPIVAVRASKGSSGLDADELTAKASAVAEQLKARERGSRSLLRWRCFAAVVLCGL